MALPNIKQALKGAVMGAAAAGMTVAPSVSFPAAANAQSASVQNVTYNTSPTSPATEWSRRNSDGVAVAVFIGQQQELTRARIESVITNEFKNHGVNKVAFFYGRHNGMGTGFSLHENGSAFGPYGVGNVKQNIPMVAEQVKLAQQNPAFAYNN